jgi:hypothetical protein
MSYNVAATVRSEVMATASSAQGAHQGHDSSFVFSFCDIVPTMREAARGSNENPAAEQRNSPKKVNEG